MTVFDYFLLTSVDFYVTFNCHIFRFLVLDNEDQELGRYTAYQAFCHDKSLPFEESLDDDDLIQAVFSSAVRRITSYEGLVNLIAAGRCFKHFDTGVYYSLDEIREGFEMFRGELDIEYDSFEDYLADQLDKGSHGMGGFIEI